MAPRLAALRLGVSVALVVAVVLAAGCTDEGAKPTVAEVSTTTDPTLAADLEPEPAPLDAEVIVAGLDVAVAAADFCALLSAIDASPPDPDDGAGAVAVYEALAAATAGARPFVPAELRLRWEDVVVGTEAAAVAVAEHDGEVADPEVEVALTSRAMVEALQAVERYQATSCPPPDSPEG